MRSLSLVVAAAGLLLSDAGLLSLRDATSDCSNGGSGGNPATGCGAQVDSIELFESQNDGTLVGSVAVGQIDCEDIFDHSGRWSIDVGANDVIEAERRHFEHGAKGLATWVGELVGEVGNAVVTWRASNPCDAKAFLLTVQRPSEGGGTMRVEYESKPVFRSNSRSSDNIVVAKLYRELQDEADPPGEGTDALRRLSGFSAGSGKKNAEKKTAAAATEVTAELDSEIALLRDVVLAHEEDRWRSAAAARGSGAATGGIGGGSAIGGDSGIGGGSAIDGGSGGGSRRLLAERLEAAGIQTMEDGSIVMPSGRRLDSGSSLDVMFVYTSNAASAMGGNTQAESKLTAAVATANAVLRVSQIALTLKLVYVGLVSYDDSSATYGGMLSDLKNGGISGPDGSTAALRNQYGADLVQMVTNNGVYCGMAYLMRASLTSTSFASQAFTVTYQGCLNYFSHIHEWGHNMGANHDNADAIDTGYPDNYAMRYCQNNGYRTVMSYACTGAPRVGYFSNPNVNYQGLPTGVKGSENNARVVNANKFYAANFRQSVSPSPTPSPTNKRPPTARPTLRPTPRPTPKPTTPKPTSPAASPTQMPTPSHVTRVQTDAGLLELVYRGCYKDTATRDIAGARFSFAQTNSLTTCTSACVGLGYRVVAMQYGIECYCGESYGSYGKLAESQCDMQCSSNVARMCGGQFANSVYVIRSMPSPTPAPTAAAKISKDYVYKGCYKDTSTNTDLEGSSLWFGSTNSPDVCNAACKGYKYFGLQASGECHCGDSYGAYGATAGCNVDCPGESSVSCGAPSKNSVYATQSSTTGSNFAYVGCYKDDWTRDLQGLYGRDLTAMTAQMCYSQCEGANAGYTYFGLQYSYECFCGWAAPSYGPSSACTMPCSGDASKICGGSLANSIYKITA